MDGANPSKAKSQSEGNMNEHSVREIARVCHEVNRAYCQAIGDNSQPEWDEAPDWQVDSAVNGVRAHLEHMSLYGKPMPPDMSHQSWLQEKQADGWRYGPVKNPETKEHPCFVPYNQLPAEQRVKDYLFGGVIKALAASNNFI
jgi:hypothetical protein